MLACDKEAEVDAIWGDLLDPIPNFFEVWIIYTTITHVNTGTRPTNTRTPWILRYNSHWISRAVRKRKQRIVNIFVLAVTRLTLMLSSSMIFICTSSISDVIEVWLGSFSARSSSILFFRVSVCTSSLSFSCFSFSWDSSRADCNLNTWKQIQQEYQSCTWLTALIWLGDTDHISTHNHLLDAWFYHFNATMFILPLQVFVWQSIQIHFSFHLITVSKHTNKQIHLLTVLTAVFFST